MTLPDEDERTPPGLPRNSAATVARILAGAQAEFGAKGLDGARMEDIARATGVSKQLIYHYFSGKDDLYSEMLVNISQRNYETLSAPDYDSLPPLGAARTFFEVLFDIYSTDTFSAKVTVDQGLHAGAQVRRNRRVEELREMLRKQLGQVLARGHESGEISQDIDVSMLHFLAVVVVAGSLALRPMFLHYTGAGQQTCLAEEACWRRTVTAFFLRGLSGQGRPGE